MPPIPFCPPSPLKSSVNSPTFANDLAKYICDFYVSLNVRSARPDIKRGQWTVLACFFLFIPNGHLEEDEDEKDGSGTIHLLTMATGLKCLAKPLDREVQVVDMHAEILARRELEYLIQLGIKQHFQSGDTTSSQYALPALSAPNDATFPLWILQQVTSPPSSNKAKLFLYSSTNFCGSASDEAHLQRLDGEDRMIREMLWGTDPAEEHGGAVGNSEMEGIASTIDGEQADGLPSRYTFKSSYRQSKSLPIPTISKKPSRPDAPPTPSYSCSDKLTRYQLLGFQGGRLAAIFEKVGWDMVRIQGVVVGEDFGSGKGLERLFGGRANGEGYSRLKEGVEEMLAGKKLDQATKDFLQPLEAITHGFRIWHTSHSFPYSRQAATLAAPNSAKQPKILTIEEVTHYRTLPLAIARDHLIPKPTLTPFPISASWHAGGTVEVLSPVGRVSGVGVNKKTGEWDERSWSMLCRRRMREESDRLKVVMLGDDAVGDEKGGAWAEPAGVMEETGPWKGWRARGKVAHDHD